MSEPTVNLKAIAIHRASRFNPLAGFTPERLTSAISDFRAGRLRDLALMMDAVEETDDVLMSVVPKAKAAVARHGWEVLTVETKSEEEKKLAARQKEELTYFYNHLRVTNAADQDEIGGVRLLFRQMMDAKGKRYAVHNIVWKPAANGHYTAELWFTPLWFFENTQGKMRYIKQPYGYEGEEMEPSAWMVTKGLGVSIACTIAWMFKHLPLRDWLVFSEKFGMPGVEGVTDAAPGSEEWNMMVTAVQSVAKDFACVHSKSSEIKTIPFGAAGTLPYPALVERMDRALSALWRGADLSTISAGSGQGQGASLQGGESELIEQDDAGWLSETLNLKLDRLVLDAIFGPDTPALAYMTVLGDPGEDLDRDLKIDAFAISHGHPISQDQFAERYNRPLPAEGAVLLTGGTQPGAGQPVQDKQGIVPDQAAAANDLSAAGREAIHKASSLQQLEAARARSLAPILDRVRELEAAATPEEYQDKLRNLQRDLPDLYKQVAADPALAQAFEEILGSAMASGLAKKPSIPVTK